jgi:hypothetical protein
MLRDAEPWLELVPKTGDGFSTAVRAARISPAQSSRSESDVVSLDGPTKDQG